MKGIGTGALAAALDWDSRTVWNAVRADDDRFDGFTYTPGNHLRWAPKRAAEIVRAFGKVPPKEWEEKR